MSGPSWRGKEPPPELARKIDRMEAMKEDPNEPDVVPGLEPYHKQWKKGPAELEIQTDAKVSRAGEIVGMIFAGVVFALLLAIVAIILIGIAHALWGLFF